MIEDRCRFSVRNDRAPRLNTARPNPGLRERERSRSDLSRRGNIS